MRYGIGETSKEFGYRSAFYDAIPCYACSAFFILPSITISLKLPSGCHTIDRTFSKFCLGS